MEHSYTNPYGISEVSTEGDCEGRTSRNLGIFEGYLNDIAFHLADKAFYSLDFKEVRIPKISHEDANSKRTEVDVRLDSCSNTWDMSSKELVKKFKKLLSGQNVYVKEGRSFACVTLSKGKPTEDERRQKALAKLTAEEPELLGL